MRDFEAIDCLQLDEHVQYRNSLGKIEEVSVGRDDIPGRPMLMVDRSKPVDPTVFLRGQPNRPGRRVARQIPKLFSTVVDSVVPDDESGRVELAKMITHPQNPLTARVIVNRVWQWHFGQPLVDTPSDFGIRCEKPIHADLIDYLASKLIENNWSLKWLHREILLSETYRQGSEMRTSAAKVDPQNIYYWRFQPRRLDWESIRDSLLFASGRLDDKEGGPPTRLAPDDPRSTCRTVFLRIDRQVVSKVARNFDFPSPDFTTATRSTTIVPQQSLFFLNSPFVLRQARHLADEDQVLSEVSQEEKVDRLFRRILTRRATANELASSLSYLQKLPQDDKTEVVSAWEYGFGELVERSGRVVFYPLPYTNSETRQGGESWPDEELHYVRLTATGGHVGIDRKHAAIRRWRSPVDGVVSIYGDVAHVPDEEDCGDGIRARVVHSRLGVLSDFTLNDDRTPATIESTLVKRGDTIDFVVDCRENHFCDLFEWSPTIMLKEESKRQEWSASRDFGIGVHAPMTRWGKLAHALLQLNEFTQLR